MATAVPRAQPRAMTTFGLHLTSYPGPDAGGSIAAYTRDVAFAAENSGVFGALWLTDHLHSLGPAGPDSPGTGIASRPGHRRGLHPAA